MIHRFLVASTVALLAACADPTVESESIGEVAIDADTLLAQYREAVPPLSPNWPGISKSKRTRSALSDAEADLLGRDAQGKDQAAWARLGSLYTEVGEYDRALWFLCRALEADPSDIESWITLARHRLTLHRPTEALRISDRVIGLNRDHPLGWATRGDALTALGDTDSAREAYEEATFLSPRNDSVELWRARMYKDLDGTQEAREHMLSSREVDDEDPVALFRLARVMRRLGLEDESTAIEIRYERAAILEDKGLLTANVSSSKKSLVVADTYLLDGRYEAARREYQNALESSNTEDHRIRAIAGLLSCAQAGVPELDAVQLAADLRALAPDHELLAR